MKKIILLLSLVLISCSEPGTTTQTLDTSNGNLPNELKGLEVYRVSTGGGNYVNVAVLNNQVNSLTYKVGKHNQSTIILNNNGRLIIVKQVLIENDTLIICRK